MKISLSSLRNVYYINLLFNFSPSNGQNIVQLLAQSAKKWAPGRERFECLIHELDGQIETAVCTSFPLTKCLCFL
jgi:hypothetical protein